MKKKLDRIILKDISFYAFHGVLPEEKKIGQTFLVSLELFLDLKQAGESDRLEDTVSYAEVYAALKNIMEGPAHDLLESLAEKIAAALLQGPVKGVCVEVKKPSPPIAAQLAYVAVKIGRGAVY
jgi:dihydroneopterin aldolase